VANEQGTEKVKGVFNWQGVIMAGNREQKWEDITLKSLEKRLRCLPEVEIPETLKAKLFASIPPGQPKNARELHMQWRSGAWAFGAAVAAVVILALIFMPNYGASVPSKRLIADLNDRTICYALADQNSVFVKDANRADCNGWR
jgi:hypothetical protein